MVLNTLEARNKLCSDSISLIFDQHCLMFDLSLVSSVCSDADFFLFYFERMTRICSGLKMLVLYSAISSGSQCHIHFTIKD